MYHTLTFILLIKYFIFQRYPGSQILTAIIPPFYFMDASQLA